MKNRTDKNKEIDWTKPINENPEITVDDFKEMVKKAEADPFYSTHTFKKKMKLWRERNLQNKNKL